jgi:cyclopropane-fatty-acyl-phospholipid synthase
MIEAVGHEYMEEFFSCCDSALADDGLLVLQVFYKLVIL